MSDSAYSELRKYIRDEHIRLPRALLQRRLGKILAASILPYLLISFSILVYHSNLTGIAGFVLHFLLFLAAQRCFQTLVHDASHRLYARNISRNDIMGNLLAAGWIGSTVQAYRSVHFRHHIHNGSTRDPEHISFSTIRARGGLNTYILRYIFGLEAVRLVRKYYFSPDDSTRDTSGGLMKILVDKWHIALCQILLFSILFMTTHWALYLLWLYLAVTWTPLLSGLRFLVEHPGDSDRTVTTLSWVAERLYFAPYNFNYHFEHHVWPSLPPYALHRAHQYLETRDFFTRHPQFLNQGYIDSLRKKT